MVSGIEQISETILIFNNIWSKTSIWYLNNTLYGFYKKVEFEPGFKSHLINLTIDIFFAKSTDGGETFDDPINVSNTEGFSGKPDIAS